MRVALLAVVVIGSGCVADVPLEGKACDDEGACADGFTCVDDVCVRDAGAGEGEGEEGEGEEGEGEEGEGEEGEGEEGEGEEGEGEGEGEGEVSPCTLIIDDRFTTSGLTSRWDVITQGPGSIVVDEGELVATVEASGDFGFRGVQSAATFDLGDASLTVALGDSAAEAQHFITLQSAANDAFDELLVGENLLLVGDESGQAPIVWDPNLERVLRLRAAEGLVHFEVSSDEGLTFEERATRPARAYLSVARGRFGVLRGSGGGDVSASFESVRLSRGACEQTCRPIVEDELDDGALGAFAFADGSMELVEQNGAAVFTLADQLAANSYAGAHLLETPREMRGTVLTAFVSDPPAGSAAQVFISAAIDDFNRVSAFIEEGGVCVDSLEQDVQNLECNPLPVSIAGGVFLRLLLDDVGARAELSVDGETYVAAVDSPGSVPLTAPAFASYGAGSYDAIPSDVVVVERVDLMPAGCE